MTELLIVGGGKMGEALLAGLLAAGRKADGIVVVEPVAARRDELAERYGVAARADVTDAEGVILAVKPDVVPAVAAEVAAAGTRRVLSIAAGVTIATMEAAGLTEPTAVVRSMPNTPALVGQGAAAMCGNAAAGDDDLDWAEEILSSVGIVVRTSEALLDAVTGLSGSGPAYVFLVAEALIDGGVRAGLPRPVAADLATQTLLGAATLLRAGTSPAELRANVTSPGGTTAAGLHALETAGVRAAFADAVAAAAARSVELGAAPSAAPSDTPAS
ncbi:MAG TPA: pyrroline-5-carboxylate reductase [Acidimicrobiaceae bacterium]|nr:pyrroline-5-carboxylate reductase [Acidimicrobiaceae bacterium]HCB36828.1 pyrroline-5-carboxylate reductase [Acidimicrobiaceae bacterium]